MRVLHVSTLYPPELNTGGTLACHNLVRALRERGHEVRVFAGSMTPGVPYLEQRSFVHDGVPVTSVNVAGRYGTVVANYHHPALADRFRAHVASWRPDVTHFHCIQALGADVLAVAKAAGSRVVVTMHDLWFACAQQFLVTPAPHLRACMPIVDPDRCDCIPEYDFAARRRFLDDALGHVDRVLGVSPYLAALLGANGIGGGKVSVSENGLLPAAPASRTSSDVVRFAFMGGAHPWKGLGTIAAALPAVRGRFRVDLHGVAPEYWKAVGGRIGDPRVRLLPPFPPERLGAVLADADGVLVPSVVPESFSLVTREALQHGVPVIASESGGPQAVLRHGDNGLLFPRGDAGALAAAMQRFLDDGAMRARLARFAPAVPVRSLGEQAEEVDAIYREIVKGPMTTDEPLPRSVLFLSGIDGAPYRYRVTHLMEQLELLGVRSASRDFRDVEALSLAGEHELLVLYRVPWDAYVEAIVSRARAAGAAIVFSVDDLIFDPSLGKVSSLQGLPRAEADAWLDGVKRYRGTLDASDAFLGSTETLAEAAERSGKRAFVHRNTLSNALLRRSESARLAAASRPRDGVRIAYLSGTNTHQRDFELIAEPLRRVLSRHPEARLVLVGHLELPRELRAVGDRVERIGFVPWQELVEVIAGVDINLAPLELASIFCDAKSEVKYLEAAAAGVVTVASATRAFRHAIRHGENGMLAASPEEWERALEQLLEDPELRGRIGRAAREDVYARSSPHVAARALADTLRKLAALRPRRDVAPLPPVSEQDTAALRAAGHGIGRPALEPSDAVPGPGKVSWTVPAPRLCGAHVAFQRFVCPPGLYRIDLFLGTHRTVNRHDLVLRIREPVSGFELACVVEDAEAASDNAWFAFEFPPLTGAAGRELVMTVEARGGSEGHGVAIWTHPNPDGGGGFDGETGLDLTFRTWARPDDWAPRRAVEPGETPEDTIRSLVEFAERERRRGDELERRLRRAEERLAILHVDLVVATGPIERLRRSLPYRAARRVYRMALKRR